MGEWIKSFFLLLVYVLFKFSLVAFATKVIVSIQQIGPLLNCMVNGRYTESDGEDEYKKHIKIDS